MPKKKTVSPAEQLTGELAPSISCSEDEADKANAVGAPASELDCIPIAHQNEPVAEAAALDDYACEDMPPDDSIPSDEDAIVGFSCSSEDTGPESDDPEYGSLLQELGQTEQWESFDDTPLTLEPLPDMKLDTGGAFPTPTDAEGTPADATSDQPERQPQERPQRIQATDTISATRRARVLTIDIGDEVQTAEDRDAVIWHEIQNAHWSRRILTGTLDGVEQLESGRTVAVVNYKGFRVMIPAKEMLVLPEEVPSGIRYRERMSRIRSILTTRLHSEIDFIVKGHENKSRSVVASRRDAMYRKRQIFYLDKDERGEPMIYEGRIVQARVVAVAEKVIRVEVFGVECPITARGLSWAWTGDAADEYHVGQRVLVRVNRINGNTVEDLSISADIRSTSMSTVNENLKKCVRQGRYAGKVTDVRGGVLFVRLSNGVNAIAHTCYDRRTPGKGDDISFAVTRLDVEHGVAIGIITRIIKQNL